MKERKVFKDISANTVQIIITQVLGLVIFYIVSKYLPKEDFGEFNWSMALGSTLVAIASLGLDLVFVKKIASGENVLVISGIHFFHTVLVGVVLGTMVFLFNYFIPTFRHHHPLFFFVFLNLCLANIANSFKLCLNGLENYKKLAIISTIANVVKLALVISLYITTSLSIFSLILAYTATSLVEFSMGFFLLNATLSSTIKPILKVKEYGRFIFESLPQLGVVLFDSALARVDWILLGIISTAAATAEYSFAYKIFELSKLPVLIIAPVLLTRFSKLFKSGEHIHEHQENEISFFLQIEMFFVMIIPIVLVITWSPLIDYITDNKYGSINEVNYLILAACIPMHAIINFLWTVGFVQSQLRVIFFITIVVSILNVVANIIFIPLYSSLGSSISFFICTLIQLLLYMKFINQSKVKIDSRNIALSFANALVAISIAKGLINNVYFAALAGVTIHLFLTYITKQVDLTRIARLVRKHK